MIVPMPDGRCFTDCTPDCACNARVLRQDRAQSSGEPEEGFTASRDYEHTGSIALDGDLLPCPFCGSPAELERDSDHHGEWFNLGCSRHWGKDMDDRCHAGRIWYTEAELPEAEAVTAWNRRAPSSAAQVAGDSSRDDLEAALASSEAEVERLKGERDEAAKLIDGLAWLSEKVTQCIDPGGHFHVRDLRADLLAERAKALSAEARAEAAEARAIEAEKARDEAGQYTEAHERLDDLARERVAAAEARATQAEKERDEAVAASEDVRAGLGSWPDMVEDLSAGLEAAEASLSRLKADVVGVLEPFADSLVADEKWLGTTPAHTLVSLKPHGKDHARYTGRIRVAHFRAARALLTLLREGGMEGQGSSSASLPAHVAGATATDAQHPAGASGPDIASIIGALKAALATEDQDMRWAFVRAALDFAENDPDTLAEGRAWAGVSGAGGAE